jgi:NitT/TauT family transport system permease protein
MTSGSASQDKPIPEAAYALGLPLVLGVAVLVGWQLAVRLTGISPVIVPAPTDIVRSFGSIAGDLLHHGWATGSEALFAFILSVLFGVAAALLLGFSTLAFETFYPGLVVFQIIPKIALAPLFTFWLGIASTSRLSCAVFISFFPVTLATMTGLKRADVNALRLCQALGASRLQTFVSVQIPYALPYFFSGAKVAATMSIIGIVVGEFISANAGLGYYMLRAQSYGETAHLFAAILVLCCIGLFLYIIPVQAERWVRRWWWN